MVVRPLTQIDNADAELREIIDSMEQGVIVWSPDAICQSFNKRVFDVLELPPGGLRPGIARADFLAMGVERGEFDLAVARRAEERFRQLAPFSFERRLPSGRVILSMARPKLAGGFVVTYTDMTEIYEKEIQLEAQTKRAMEAETRATEALTLMRTRERDSRRMSQLGEWLQSCKSLEELLDILGKFLGRLFVGSSGELFIYSTSRDVLDSVCSWNLTPGRDHIEPEDCWSLRRGRMYTYGDDLIDVTCGHVHQAGEAAGRYVCIPVIAHGDTVGLLHIRFADEDEDGRSREDCRELVIRCAEQISLAVANVQLRDELHDQSVRDPLTGLYNRRYFLDRCRRAIAHSARCDGPLAIVSLDADHFKRFNDNHGHDAGDSVLRAIADCMTKVFEGNAVVARFGGEEFSVLLPDTDGATALQAAETLRQTIERRALYHGEQQLPTVTVSIGVAAYPDAGRTPEDLLRVADAALYVAKDKGRNQVVVFEE
jgi:diguanylate cyclase (GGDEF)-like protein